MIPEAQAYTNLFDFFFQEHGLKLLYEEMDEIVKAVERFKAEWGETPLIELLNNNSDGWIEAIDVLKDGYYIVFNPNAYSVKIEIARYSSYNESWYQGSDCIHPTHYKLLPNPPIKVNNK